VLEGDDYTGLYRDVLIDTPVGVYFMRFLEESLEGMGENRTMNDIQALFRDMKPEFIRTSLKRMWLEDLNQFVSKNLSGESQQLMHDLVNFEADMKTIQVVYNSLGNRDSSNTARVFVLRK
jgi:V-type H+-transporting ATPase subunit d